MTDKLGLGCEIQELKLGSSFTNSKSSSYHTIKYDFKPASVDVNKMATVDVGTSNQVTVTVPHLDGAGVPCTVFKGNQRPYTKECVLIIDRVTGEITLEKLSSNIQVKKTRQESSHRNNIPAQTSHNTSNSTGSSNLTAAQLDIGDCTQRSSSRTRVASGTIKRPNVPTPNGTNPYVSGNNASRAPEQKPNAPRTPPSSASSLMRSPLRHKTSPPQSTPWSVNAGNSTLASLPLIGFDDPPSNNNHSVVAQTLNESSSLFNGNHMNYAAAPTPPEISMPDLSSEVGILSSSSGSSSESDSESESEGPHNVPEPAATRKPTNGMSNGKCPDPSVPMHLLNDDLCLSESGSDSD